MVKEGGYKLNLRSGTYTFNFAFVLESRGDKPAITYHNGTKIWLRNGKAHRENDLPAVVSGNQKLRKWFKNGLLHRDDDKPAEICTNKDNITLVGWYQNGKRHRDNDLPAIIIENGDKTRYNKIWFQNGIIHRFGDKPARITNMNQDGTHHVNELWYSNNMLHRDGDKPAVISSNGTTIWYYNGVKHRENNLPAVVSHLGKFKIKAWWFNGKRIHTDVFPPISNVIIKTNKRQVIDIDPSEKDRQPNKRQVIEINFTDDV